MTTPWRKALRDVWRERPRAVLVILAMAAGLAAFLSVLSTYAILGRELNRGYLASTPASAVFLVDAVDDALRSAVAARDDVESAEARRVVVGRIRTGSGQWRRLILFVLRDFERQQMSVVTREAGEWPPATGSILLERDAFQVAGVQIGDVVTVATSGGVTRTLQVGGRVHDVGQAQARMENLVYAYTTRQTLSLLGEPPVLDRLLVLASGDRMDRARVDIMVEGVRAALAASGHAVRRVDVPMPGEHPHAVIMGILLLAMALFGLFALALSGVIVTNLLLAMIAVERRQIGVMRAVGGTRRQIGLVYLAEAALFGGAAIVVATPIGWILGRLLSRYFGVLLNFDLNSLAVPAWVYLLVVVVGLVAPLAAAAYPVAAGTRISVREALASTAVNPATFGTRRFDRLVSRIGGSHRPLLFGVRNLARAPRRTVLTLVTISVAGMFFVSALSIRASMIATADRRFGAGTFGAIERYAWDQHMLMIYVFLLIVAGVFGLVGGLGLMTTMSLNVLERRREYGVLRAIGATPAMIAGLVVAEALVIAHLSWLIALAAGWAITVGVGRLLTATLFPRGFDIVIAPAAVTGWIAISSVVCVAASLVPAVVASRNTVREAVSHE